MGDLSFSKSGGKGGLRCGALGDYLVVYRINDDDRKLPARHHLEPEELSDVSPSRATKHSISELRLLLFSVLNADQSLKLRAPGEAEAELSSSCERVVIASLTTCFGAVI